MEAATARLAPSPRNALRAPWSRLRSDEALVDQFRAGDESAFELLYRRHEARMFAICLGVLGSPHDANDAMQEVWASVADALRAHPPDQLRPWLARAARNAAIDVVRRRREEPRAEPEGGHIDTSAGLRADLAEVVDGLKELPEGQRSALVLRELGGYTYAEIAGALDVEEKAVNGLVARARLSLRAHADSTALACSTVREHIAGEEDGRRRPAEIRRHMRACSGCREFQKELKRDSHALRALVPAAGIGIVPILVAARGGKSVIFGGLLAKGLFGGELSKLAIVCLAGVCATAGVEQVAHLAPDRGSSAQSGSKDGSGAADAFAAGPNSVAAVAITAPAERPFLRDLTSSTTPVAGQDHAHRAPAADGGERGAEHRRGAPFTFGDPGETHGRNPAARPEHGRPVANDQGGYGRRQAQSYEHGFGQGQSGTGRRGQHEQRPQQQQQSRPQRQQQDSNHQQGQRNPSGGDRSPSGGGGQTGSGGQQGTQQPVKPPTQETTPPVETQLPSVQAPVLQGTSGTDSSSGTSTGQLP